MNIDGKRVLLTGASGGIGQALARQLATAGAHLTLVGRQADALQTLRQQLPDPQHHQVLPLDLATREGRATLAGHARQQAARQQGFDVLINNAGGNRFALLQDRSAAELEAELALNLTVPMLLCQDALHWLNRPGIILNVGSTFGGIGYPGYSIYSAAKAGLYRFSEALARELDGDGIRVLHLAPRATDTALNDGRVKAMNRALGNRMDSPDTVARALVRCLTREQSSRWLGWPENWFVRINNLLPDLVSSSIRKQHATILRFAQSKSHQ